MTGSRVTPAPPRSLLITGASSGIGRALALEYAAPGIHLALSGRDAERLRRIADDCIAKGAEVTPGRLDVRDRRALADWIAAADARRPIDLAIPSAGISSGIGRGRPRESLEAVRAVFAINLGAVIDTLDPVLDRMCARGRGQVALIGSLAGLRGLPYSPAYSASKAALHAYGEALRAGLAPLGVTVSIVYAGFVETDLNRRIDCPKPEIIGVERAARIIRRGLDRRRPAIRFPLLLYLGTRLLGALPSRVLDRAMMRIAVEVPETREGGGDQERP